MPQITDALAARIYGCLRNGGTRNECDAMADLLHVELTAPMRDAETQQRINAAIEAAKPPVAAKKAPQ